MSDPTATERLLRSGYDFDLNHDKQGNVHLSLFGPITGLLLHTTVAPTFDEAVTIALDMAEKTYDPTLFPGLAEPSRPSVPATGSPVECSGGTGGGRMTRDDVQEQFGAAPDEGGPSDRMADEIVRLRAIFAALREPRVWGVDAMEAETPISFREHWLAHVFRGAVAVAEKEVGDE